MKRFARKPKLVLAAMVCCLLSAPAYAALGLGASAPDFSAKASLGGKEFDFSLAAALKNGPVVLYFYPAAFTRGCTYEAHAFADSVDKFAALEATVIGVSNDAIVTLDKFSVSVCNSKFAVVSDPAATVIKAYDAKLTMFLGNASRTSYGIAPDGKIFFVYSDMDPDKHVERTLGAVQNWRAKK
jgi:thioredoxin-dependent peroxiredoxin